MVAGRFGDGRPASLERREGCRAVGFSASSPRGGEVEVDENIWLVRQVDVRASTATIIMWTR